MSTNVSVYVADWNVPTFYGHPREDAQVWISTILSQLIQREVACGLWVAIVLHFLGEAPRAVLEGVRATMGNVTAKEGEADPGEWEWDWDRLTRTLVLIHEKVQEDSENTIRRKFLRFKKEYPYAAAAAGLGLVAAGGITVGPAVLVGSLNMMGFTASGVVGGSVAAGIQSAVYGGAVGAGSAFALAQSAAAGGIAVASVGTQIIGAGVMILGTWVGCGGGADDDAAAAYRTRPARH